jgi:hypothetical protein
MSNGPRTMDGHGIATMTKAPETSDINKHLHDGTRKWLKSNVHRFAGLHETDELNSHVEHVRDELETQLKEALNDATVDCNLIVEQTCLAMQLALAAVPDLSLKDKRTLTHELDALLGNTRG